jgi:hypothetical protein
MTCPPICSCGYTKITDARRYEAYEEMQRQVRDTERVRPVASGWTMPPVGAACLPEWRASAGSGSHHGVAGFGGYSWCARQFGIDRAC